MEYRRIGKSDISASVIALGCWQFAGDATWGDQDEAASIQTVHAAMDVGINFFDTAEAYGAGRSEEVLGKALVGRRDKAIIATKASDAHHGREELVAACERSLRFLQTDYIDLYQLHWPSRDHDLVDTMATMEKLVAQGKVRAIGVCNFGVQDTADLMAVGRAESNQLPYSLLWRTIEDEILPLCIEHNMGVLCYSPLAQGLLTGKYGTPDSVPPGRARTRFYSSARAGTRHGEAGCEAETFAAIQTIRRISERIGAPMATTSLAWLIQQPGVAAVLAGGRKPEHITQNAQAVELAMSDEIQQELAAATDDLKALLGTNPDQYQGAANSRFR